METQKSFWQQVREKHYAQGMSRPTEELVAEFNHLVFHTEVFSQSVTARLTALADLFRFRGYDLSALRKDNHMKLCRIKIEDGKVLPLEL
jgi:hypothetical protein